MSVQLFTNNFSTTLSAGIAPSDTTITLLSVTGLPTISGDQFYLLSLFDAATQLITEIVKVTARTGFVVTVVRAQEGTTALSWNAGDIAANDWTAGSARAMQQTAQAQNQSANYAVDTGTANAKVAAFTPSITAYTAGLPVRVKWANPNTGAATLDAGAGAAPIQAFDGSALVANDLTAGEISELVYTGTAWQVQPTQATISRPGLVLAGFTVKAYALFSVSGGVLTVHNIANCSMVRNSTGNFSVTLFNIPFPIGGAIYQPYGGNVSGQVLSNTQFNPLGTYVFGTTTLANTGTDPPYGLIIFF